MNVRAGSADPHPGTVDSRCEPLATARYRLLGHAYADDVLDVNRWTFAQTTGGHGAPALVEANALALVRLARAEAAIEVEHRHREAVVAEVAPAAPVPPAPHDPPTHTRDPLAVHIAAHGPPSRPPLPISGPVLPLR